MAILRLLLAHPVPVDTQALEYAAANHHVHIVQELRANNAPVDPAIMKHLANNPTALALLLDAGLKPAIDALVCAIRGNHDETVNLLLQREPLLREPPPDRAMSRILSEAILNAVTHQRIQILKSLQRHGIKLDNEIGIVAGRIKSPSFRTDFEARLRRQLEL